MSVNTERFSVQSKTCLRVTGLSEMIANNRTKKLEQLKLEHELGGLWKVVIEFPGRSKSPESHLKIHIGPSFTSRVDYGLLGVLTISISLESLEGEELQRHSDTWDLKDDSKLTEGCSVRMMSWSTLWTENAEIQRSDGFRIAVDITSVPPPIRPVVEHPLILNNVLELMEGQDVIDTKFLVFSNRRVVDGVVGASDPLPVYANALVMRSQCDYFETMLGDSDFSESRIEDFDGPPTHSFIDRYDDDKDSDLGYFSGEEEENLFEDGDVEEGKTSPLRDPSWLQSSSRPDLLTGLEDSEHGNDLTTGRDLESTVFNDDSDEEQWVSSISYRKHCRHHNRFGRVVSIQDHAHVTWKALIFYLYTSQISFAPLTARKEPRSRSKSERSQGLPSRPSAKSIYRVADKLGLADLTKLALQHIESQLTDDIVIPELFSTFTSRYSAVKEAELAYVSKNWDVLKTSPMLSDMLSKVSREEMPHAADILARLLSRLC